MIDAQRQDLREINEYLDRFQSVDPDRILDWIEEGMEFSLKHMTREGRAYFFETRRPPLEGWDLGKNQPDHS